MSLGSAETLPTEEAADQQGDCDVAVFSVTVGAGMTHNWFVQLLP